MATRPVAVPEPTDDQEVVAANVRALMGRHRVSQEALARVIGVSGPQLSQRLNGHVNLTVRELGLIARFFGKTMAELVTLGKLPLELVPSRPPRGNDGQRPLPFLHTVR